MLRLSYISFFVLSYSLLFLVSRSTFAASGKENKASAAKGLPIELNDGQAICTTSGCVHASKNLISSINESADPCEDFFAFACGGWLQQHPIPQDMDSYSTTQELSTGVLKKLRILLESQKKTPSRAITMAKDMYKICMNTTAIDALKSMELLEALKELGGWPMLDISCRNAEKTDLTSLLSEEMAKYGESAILDFYIDVDHKNGKRHIIYLDQDKLGLGTGSRDYFVKPEAYSKYLDAYRSYQKSIVNELLSDSNISRNQKDIDVDLKEIFDFETKLAKISTPEEERSNSTRMYNPRRIEQLYEIMPQIDWLRYFQTIIPRDVPVNNRTEVIVREIKFLKSLPKILKETGDRAVVNFIMWRFAKSWITSLDTRLNDIRQRLVRSLTGQQTKQPRWKECVHSTMDGLPYAVAALFVREYFHPNDKKEVKEIIKNLRSAYGKMIKESDWMDDKTKIYALEKLDAMVDHVGYPEILEDDKKLDENYEELRISDSDTYFETSLKTTIWQQNKLLMQLNKKFDRHEYNEFIACPAEVNAYNKPDWNALMFMAAILQPPFFSGEYPKMVNYGAVGSIIGHEMTHGFDNQGCQYDKDGGMRNWWDNDTYKMFEAKKQCVIDDYNKFTIPNTEIKGNGELTQGENIADLGGVKEAYRAYMEYIKQKGAEEPRLPGLEKYTNEQIFFVSYAYSFCGHQTDDSAVRSALTDEHALHSYRVNGVLANYAAFADAFQCPEESRMNPAKKCSVW